MSARDPGGMGTMAQKTTLLISAYLKVASTLGLTLSNQAAILGVSQRTVGRWKTSPPVNAPDKLDRMAVFMELYGLARQACPGKRGAVEWLRRPNTSPMFHGRAPLDLILDGRLESLTRVRDHLTSCVRIW